MANYVSNTAANQTQVNGQAAQKVNEILNNNKVKGSIAKLAKLGSGIFKKITEGIHDTSKMTDDQVRTEVSRTFKEAKEKLQKELSVINSIPSYRDSQTVKDMEEGLEVFILIEKNILNLKDMNVIRKGLLMFWTGVKYISGLIVKSCIVAGKFVSLYGIRIITVGLDFIIKVVKKTAGILKSTWKGIKAIKVSSSGKEEEINPETVETPKKEEKK